MSGGRGSERREGREERGESRDVKKEGGRKEGDGGRGICTVTTYHGL